MQFTIVYPSANTEPEAGTHAAVPLPSTASWVAGEAYVTTAPEALIACSITSSCESIAGALVSTTLTLNEAVPVLPAASVAVQFTVVLPKTKVELE